MEKEEITLLSQTYECKRIKKRPPILKLVNIRSANGLNTGLHLHNLAEKKKLALLFYYINTDWSLV